MLTATGFVLRFSCKVAGVIARAVIIPKLTHSTAGGSSTPKKLSPR